MSGFVHGGMTPRAWRMISYICIGATVYGMVLVAETLQTYKLNRIDLQMKMLNEQLTEQTPAVNQE